MKYKILISGNRANFTTLVFDDEKKEIDILASYAAPFNASWTEPSSSQGSVDRLIGLSEGDETGLLYTFEIDHEQKTCRFTSTKPTLGMPAHFITLHDNSALALSTYMGGSIALYQIEITHTDGLVLTDASRSEIIPEFPYASQKHGPNEDRQRQCHVHQVLEDKRGLLYAPDLGSDRVWILRRSELELEICGWLQCPPGTGARHAVFSPDEKIMYVIGELSHTITAYDLTSAPAEDIQPIQNFAPSIIAPDIHSDHQFMMDSSEICLHPTIPNVLYASNRWARHIALREPHLKNVPMDLPAGDDIAIILLSKDGKQVEKISHIRTNLDVIRGMRLTDDGKYMVVLGQEGGGIEIYEISGDRGDLWSLVAGLNEGLESGIKHAVWL